ncbi:fimbria/pilus periplasmic chaperone [Photobacterium phosphoreum]|uniref:fimbria/pilus periplasmic chaperone n=1 Tax=Photobacterium phosphoreum TaxID=659 RepID=UPI0015E6BA4A|nr:fimbria/pilus periplasmic chaperone [Photobacterium phosphoreum]
MKIKYTLLAVVCSFMVVNTASAALALDATRYIYDGDATSISAIVNNASDKMYGAQVWVANMDKSDTRPVFIATPSFFKIKGHGKQVFRIMKMTDYMPKNKESVYWLNLQEIPPLLKGNGISMAIRTRVKLIYRPQSLIKGRKDAESRMTIEYLPGEQYLVNSTPYIFSIGELLNNKNKPVVLNAAETKELTMFMPGDKVNITGKTVKAVKALNDYGNLNTYVLKTSDNNANATEKKM